MSSPSQLPTLPPLLLRAACLLLLITPVNLAEGWSSVTSAAILPGQCIAIRHEFDTNDISYTAKFGSFSDLRPGCLLRLSGLYRHGACSSERNHKKRGCSTSTGSEVGPSFCRAVFADAPSDSLHTPPVPTTSFFKFDAGTIEGTASTRGYVFAAYDCTNTTAAGEASTPLEFDIEVEWGYYLWPVFIVILLVLGGLVACLLCLVLILNALDKADQAKCRKQHVSPVATKRASSSKAQPPPPSTAPVRLAPPSTVPERPTLPSTALVQLAPPSFAPVPPTPPSAAPVQLAPPPSIAGGSASVHANVTRQPTTSRPTPVDVTDSAGNPPLLTPSPLDPPAAAVDGSSNQTAASHQHVSWRELVTATIRRRGVKAAQD